MARLKTRTQKFLAAALMAASGCALPGCIANWKLPPGPRDTTKSYYDTVATRIEYPDVKTLSNEASAAANSTAQPLTLEDPSQLPSWELTLEQAVQMAIGQGPVLRTLGVSVVDAPNATSTIYDPALVEANPLGGVEAALSDFDAQFAGQLFWQKNDQPQNVDPTGAVAFFRPLAFQQTLANYNTELSKTTATGATFTARHNVIYDRPNSPGRFFSSDFAGFFEGEYRQPLMQGRGTEFNRIAGPNSQIGVYNGVLIARVNNDISLTDFEAAVIQTAYDVEQAYWDLYFAYRNLEAQLRGREAALQTFQYQELRLNVGAGRSDEEAQARSQYYQFQVQVENGLAGEAGLYKLEQSLRYMLGLPAADGRLIKPATDPHDARVVFDWNTILNEGLERRVEIRRQKWNIKKRELELTAARLNKKPRLDFLGQYRWRGLGDHLIGDDDTYLDSMYGEIAGGDFQEWQAGLELAFPVGLRRAAVAISHAQLNLSRERALMNETELRISHDLADASRDVQRQYQLLKTNFNRWVADRRQLEVLRERYRRGADNINFLLQAQRQVISSESDYYATLVSYNLAMRDLHRQKGTLLAYNHIHMSEGGWHSPAYREACEQGRFFRPCPHPDAIEAPCPVSRGPFDPSAPGVSSMPVTEAAPAMAPEAPTPVISTPPDMPTLDSPSNAQASIAPIPATLPQAIRSPMRLPNPGSQNMIQQVSY
ncbi:TolC family protein [Rosistilla oblonga]|uniref:TolC family protein n=1 Tax=Rosistilla oblonga TaxID=2527990 RepID=UPI003A97A264